MHKLFFVFLLTLTLASCEKSDSIDSNSTAAQTSLNVSYGTDVAQKMDIYLPANRSTTSTKVIVMIHGGGWTSGDKSDFTSFVDTLKRRLPGYAIFNINYRLSANPNNLFPTQEMDVKAAIEFIYSKSSEYKISEKYVLMGASAGGHLAMLQGYKYNAPVKAKAIVSFFGPSDMADMYNNPVGGNPLFSLAVANAVGATPSQNPLLYTNSSPVNYISNSTAMPTILLHGGLDPLVSPSHSTMVESKLNLAGITNQYVFYPTGGHGDWDTDTYTDAFNKIEAFIETNVP